MIHEVAFDFRVFDFESLVERECRIDEIFREYLLIGVHLRARFVWSLVQNFYANESHRPMLRLKVGGIDVLITEDTFTRSLIYLSIVH